MNHRRGRLCHRFVAATRWSPGGTRKGSPDSSTRAGSSQRGTEEAIALLKKVASGSVPTWTGVGLTRIAEENGVVVKPTDTPEQVIKALREIDARSTD